MSALTKLITVSSSDSHGCFESNYIHTVTFSKAMILTSIANRMFISNKIRTIDLSPLALTSIGSYAFYDNDIASITWSKNITSLGIGAFKYNALTTLDLSPLTKLETLTSSTSHGCFESNSIYSITFTPSLTTIGDRAFMYNKIYSLSLSSLSKLTSIGYLSFYMSNIDNIDFTGASKLITIGEGNK